MRKKTWRDYIHSDNPAAAALLSKMNYTDDERVQVKKEFLRMLVNMQLDPAKERLIYGFFENYLTLSETEEEQLMREVSHMDDAHKIMEIPISYEEKGKEKGKEIGREEGREEGIQSVAKEVLRKDMPIDLIAEVTKLTKKEIESLEREL